MIYFAIFFALSAIFWGYVTFRDARWVADEEGPSVWDYAAVGVFFCAVAAAFCVVCLWAALS